MAKLDKYTLEQAEEYANNEAEVFGFAKNTRKWKEAYDKYEGWAKGTMSVGRAKNPFMRNPNEVLLHTELLGPNGIAQKIANNYTRDGQKGVPVEYVQGRIKAAVSNLVDLLEGGLGIKTKASVRKAGKIKNTEMADTQMPSSEGATKEQLEAAQRQVVMNQLVSNLLKTVLYENLLVFYSISSNDINKLLERVEIEKFDPKKFNNTEWINLFVESVQDAIRPAIRKCNIPKIISGE